MELKLITQVHKSHVFLTELVGDPHTFLVTVILISLFYYHYECYCGKVSKVNQGGKNKGVIRKMRILVYHG